MTDKKKLTNNAGAPVADNQNVMTAGRRGPQLLQDVWFLEKLAHLYQGQDILRSGKEDRSFYSIFHRGR
jgi:catalase